MGGDKRPRRERVRVKELSREERINRRVKRDGSRYENKRKEGQRKEGS